MVATHILPVDMLREVAVQENGEKMVDLRIECPEIDFEIADYLLSAEYSLVEYENAHFVRKSVANMLGRAQGSLPEGYSLLIRCGYRTPEVQTREFQKDYEDLMRKHPRWTKDRLDTVIEDRWASLDIAPHCTGGAVDLTIVDVHGKQLDMGTRMGHHGLGTATHTDKLLAEQRVNRHILLDTMTGVGFINYPGEWWHYSYGAREWAAYANSGESFYGPIERLRIYSEEKCVTSCLLPSTEECS